MLIIDYYRNVLDISNVSNNEDTIDEDTSDPEKYCQICLMKFDNKRKKMEPIDFDKTNPHICINKCCIDCVRDIYISTRTYNCPFCRKEFKDWITNVINDIITDLKNQIKNYNINTITIRNNNNINNIINNIYVI